MLVSNKTSNQANKEKEELFTKNLNGFMPFLVGLARKHSIAGMSSDDIVQDVSLRLWMMYDRFDKSKSAFNTWANMVACGTIKNLYRDSMRLKRACSNQAEDIDSIDEEELASEYSPNTALENKEMLEGRLKGTKDIKKKKYYVKLCSNL
jgi:RNA polymerase sigma factor (sigma-70 family)